MRSARVRVAVAALVALVAVAFATAAFGQTGDDDNFTDASERVTSARGGDGGDVRGGAGGRGGSGALPVCNQNSNDDDDFDDNRLSCIAGSSGGRGGDAGESVGGDGGVAFDLGGFRPQPPAPAPTPQSLADLVATQRRGSFRVIIENKGPSTASGIVLTDTLSVDTSYFLTVTPSQGTCSSVPSGEIAAGSITITCFLGSLAPGPPATVVIDPVPVENGHAVNDVFVAGATPDPNISNNSSTLQQTLILEPLPF